MTTSQLNLTEIRNIVDLTQADLDRGMTPEEIARDRADLNITGFCHDLAQAINQHREDIPELQEA